MEPARGFRRALADQPGLSVIAEIKRRSPSKGDLNVALDPADLATTYARGGAACLSVLTDVEVFGGAVSDLQSARAATSLPVLRKDFTVSAIDVAQTRLIGADAVLLIVAALDRAELSAYHQLAVHLDLDALVEVHDEAELEVAIGAGAELVGINNRDLRTFETRLETTLGLLPTIPPGVTVVSESGFSTAADVRRVVSVGAHAVLIGEGLVKAKDVGAKVRELALR